MAPVGVGHLVAVGAGLDQEALPAQVLDHPFAGLIDGQALVRPPVLVDGAVGVEDVDRGQVVAPADLVIDGVVGGRHLEEARGVLGHLIIALAGETHQFVSDDG